MNKKLIGIGIGPFNLSLAALLEKAPGVDCLFLERKEAFDWHTEVMFADSYMQTSYLKDLVTPVDPTSPYSFLNYLVRNGLFESFMNTGRQVVSRREFEMYCQWVSRELGERLRFGAAVEAVDFQDGAFWVRTSKGEFRGQNLCLGTGLVPRVLDCARPHLGKEVFHAKSASLPGVDLSGKSVVVIGGGQTGIEVFRNALGGKWGRPQSIKLVTRRQNLEPLDETPFTNEYFTANYVNAFWNVGQRRKAEIVSHQKLASDGNTPTYLSLLYNDLYRRKYVEKDPLDVGILAFRKLETIRRGSGGGFILGIENGFLERKEELAADVVILCTGFTSAIPSFLEPLRGRIEFDALGRFVIDKSFAVRWDGPVENRIYALNFSRHSHGISEPQTSLMSWRSASVVNDLSKREIYLRDKPVANFVQYT